MNNTQTKKSLLNIKLHMSDTNEEVFQIENQT